MRVLHVIPQFPWFGGRTIIGGHASSLLNLALAQDGTEVEPTILTYVHDRGGEHQITPNVRVVSLFEHANPGTARFGLQFLSAATRWARDHRGAFDLVHGHSGFADYALVSARLKSVLDRPTIHSMYCPIAASGHRVNGLLARTLIRRAARRLDAVTAMSRNTADSMEAYGFGPGDVEVIPPPLDLGRFRPTNNGELGSRGDLGLTPEDFVVLFVGNAKPQKNMVGVLHAMAEVRRTVPGARLVVTTELPASSSDENLAGLRRTIDDLGLTPFVVQKGIIDDMPALMRSCDVLVAPFLDSFGPSDYFVAVLEAMASGKPTVVSRGGGMPEIVNDDVGRLVDPHDHDAIAGALLELAGDASLRTRLGRQAQERAESLFEPSAVAASVLDLYQRITRS